MRSAVERLSEIPNTLSRWALGIARELGKRVYDPRSIARINQRAVEAANMSVRRDVSRGIRRDGGMSL